MSHLPPDPLLWPQDPHELLGISPTADKKEIRRAYAALAKEYKPDHHPAEFQRIRDAYDAALNKLDFDAAVKKWTAIHANDPPGASLDHAQPGAGSEPAAAPARPAPAVHAGGIDADDPNALAEEAWKLLEQGDEQAAYARMRALKDRFPHETNLSQRLFWMLHLHPELDAKRFAADEVLELSQDESSDPRNFALVRLAYGQVPASAFSPAADAFLKGRATPNAKLQFARLRWAAAARMSEWDRIDRDVETLREQFTFENERFLLQALLAAADETAWAANVPYFNKYLKEANAGHATHPDMAAALERLDVLAAVQKDWFALRMQPKPWCDLLPAAWNRRFEEIEERIWPLLAELAKNPVASYQRLDRMFVNRRASLAVIVGLFENAWYTVATERGGGGGQEAERNPAHFADEIRRLARRSGDNETQPRRILCWLCLCHRADPDSVASFIENDKELRRNEYLHYAAYIRGDYALRAVYLAGRCVFG